MAPSRAPPSRFPPTSGEELIRRAHAEDPGGTPRCFERYRHPAEGWCSYDRLTAAVREGESGRVLDLGCGDGVLLARLGGHPGGAVGLDLSAAELTLGRARLGRPARLAQGHAAALPFADASFAVVASHMVLMLIDPLPPVLGEVARVLRPGGRLLAVLGAGRSADPVREVFTAALRDGLAEDGVAVPRIGDPRSRDPEALRVACAGAGLRVEAVEELRVCRAGAPEEVWEDLGAMYDARLLSPGARARVRARFLEGAGGLADSQGRVPASFDLRLVEARR